MKSWVGGHKALVGVGALGVVAFLAYRSRAATAPADAAGGSTVGNPQGAAIAGYDSSASDIYNALQPQIDQTQGLIRKLLVRIRQDRKENRRLARQVRRARQGGHHHRRHKPAGVQTPPTKPPRQPSRLSARLGTVSGGPERRLPAPAPTSRPRAVVTRRQTSMAQISAADRTPVVQLAAMNRSLPADTLPAGTRVVLPPRGGRRR